MAAVLPIISAVGGVLGIMQSIKGLKGSKEEAPAAPPMPEAPKMEDAQGKAAEDVKKRRRMSLLSGGMTDITKGTADVGAGNVGLKNLVGQ